MAAQWIRGINKIDIQEEVLEDLEDRTVITRYTPLGVVGTIVPWNYPIAIAIEKISPALVTGNTIIVKPSPFTPYCSLKMVELAQQFFPPGVIQVLSGDDNLGPWITSHPGIDKITFTGSTATGKKVMESASKSLKRITLELGGNDPAIVCKDVDIAKVAPAIAQLAFLNSGQVCLAIKRIYIHESIYSEFRAAMIEATKQMQIGDGFKDGVFLGPIQNEIQYERVRGFFDDIEKQGQKIAVGGEFEQSQGYFVQPTIVDNPSQSSRIVLEEPFGMSPLMILCLIQSNALHVFKLMTDFVGPILPIMPWSTEEEVIKRANDTQTGLGASVWSADLKQAAHLARQLEAGNVWVNAHLEVSPAFPFSGHKQSGIGSEGGIVGLKSFCNLQSLFLKK